MTNPTGSARICYCTCFCAVHLRIKFEFELSPKAFLYFHVLQNPNANSYCVVLTDCRPDESFFVKLDSNLKRNTAFVKKLVSNFSGSWSGKFRSPLMCIKRDFFILTVSFQILGIDKSMMNFHVCITRVGLSSLSHVHL